MASDGSWSQKRLSHNKTDGAENLSWGRGEVLMKSGSPMVGDVMAYGTMMKSPCKLKRIRLIWKSVQWKVWQF